MPFSIIGGIIGAAGSLGAAGESSQASEDAVNEEHNEFNTATSLTAPQRQLGYGADNILASLYGIAQPYGGNQSGTSIPTQGTPGYNTSPAYGGGTLNLPGLPGGVHLPAMPAQNGNGLANPSAPNFSAFYNTPGYQFSLDQGQKAISRSAAAGGNLYSTNTLNQLDQNAQGYASTQYNNYVQQLFGLAGLGGQASTSNANNAVQTGSNVASAIQNAGNANASGIAGATGAITNGLKGANWGGSSNTPETSGDSGTWGDGSGYTYNVP